METHVFYCSNCKQTFVGSKYNPTDRPHCPNCNKRTQPTGFTKEVWVGLSADERQRKLDAVTLQEEKKENRKAYAWLLGVAYEENAKRSDVDLWYSDIGKKIKGWAKAIFIIESILFIISAIIMLSFAAEDEVWLPLALVTAILGPVVSWISSWLLYAFGELVDKTAANERNTQNILKLMLDSNANDQE